MPSPFRVPVQTLVESQNRLRDALADNQSLSSQDVQVIRLRFGLDDDNPLTREEVGDLLGISYVTLQGIEKRVLRVLGLLELLPVAPGKRPYPSRTDGTPKDNVVLMGRRGDTVWWRTRTGHWTDGVSVNTWRTAAAAYGPVRPYPLADPDNNFSRADNNTALAILVREAILNGDPVMHAALTGRIERGYHESGMTWDQARVRALRDMDALCNTATPSRRAVAHLATVANLPLALTTAVLLDDPTRPGRPHQHLTDLWTPQPAFTAPWRDNGDWATYVADQPDTLADEQATVRDRFNTLQAAPRPNYLLPILHVLASHLPWPANLNPVDIRLLVEQYTVALPERIQKLIDTQPDYLLPPSWMVGWAATCGPRARAVLMLAGQPATGFTGEVLRDAVTSALTWREAQGLQVGAALGEIAFERALGAARWIALLRTAVNVPPLPDDVTDAVENALPPAWQDLGMQIIGEGLRLRLQRPHVGSATDTLVVDLFDETASAVLARTSPAGEATEHVELTFAELCLFMAEQHTLPTFDDPEVAGDE